MTSVYDDIFYVETLKEMDYLLENDSEGREKNDYNHSECIDGIKEHPDDFTEIIECLNQKKMFEKELKRTLKKLNKTNPALEPGKYHMLCIYANRYNKYITQIENKILWYEWRRLRREKQTIWSWSWKLMSYFKKREQEPLIVDKNKMEKKKD